MGVWGYFQPPLEPPEPPEWEELDRIAEQESLDEFVEREISYRDAMEICEDIATDEGGWGAWMGGEL